METTETTAESSSEERGFRLSVCLLRFFSDERARSWMWVPTGAGARGRRVRWLRRRLRALFGLRGRLRLLAAGRLLPPDEPLALLRPSDSLEVIPVSEDFQRSCIPVESVVNNESEQNGDVEYDEALQFIEVKSRDESDAPFASGGGEEGGAGGGGGRDVDDINFTSRLAQLKRRALNILEGMSDPPVGLEPPAGDGPIVGHEPTLPVSHEPTSPFSIEPPAGDEPIVGHELTSPAGSEPPAKRRRRVRRRRRRALSPPPPAPPPPPPPAPGPTPVAAGPVLHNDSAASRPPRLIRALSPRQLFQLPLNSNIDL